MRSRISRTEYRPISGQAGLGQRREAMIMRYGKRIIAGGPFALQRRVDQPQLIRLCPRELNFRTRFAGLFDELAQAPRARQIQSAETLSADGHATDVCEIDSRQRGVDLCRDRGLATLRSDQRRGPARYAVPRPAFQVSSR